MPRGRTPRRRARSGRQDRVAGAPMRQAQGRLLPAKAAERRKKINALSKPVPTKNKAYNPLAPDRIAEILKRLDQLYPDVTCALTHSRAWELLVATILSAQSTAVNVNAATPQLFRKYPTVDAFAPLTPDHLQP